MLDCAKRCVFVPHQIRAAIRYRSESEPHPHLLIEEIVPAAVYERLRFPDDLIEPQAGWGLTAADPLYETLLLDPGWRALHDELRGEPFVRDVLACFADQLRHEGCLVDPERARVVRFTESREQKERGALSPDADPNEVYTR